MIRIAPWPIDRGNPYQQLFYRALEPAKVTLVEGLSINDDSLRDLASRIDVIHLHWPEYAWRVQGTSTWDELRSIVGLGRFLRLAKRLGLAVWWTAHNIVPHEGRSYVNYLGYRIVAAYADLVVAHSTFAAQEVRRRYHAREPVVMPIGNFDNTFPAPRSREEVFETLGLDPRIPLVTCLGTIRRYKGIPIALDAVSRLDGRVQLLVAGDPKPDVDVEVMQHAAATHPWVRVVLRHISDQEFSDFTAASDAILLPYVRATTSAVLLAAWSMGRGVIASDIRCFADELADHPRAGTLAAVDDPAAFAAAIEQYLAMPSDQRRAAVLAASAAHSWPRCVGPLLDAIRERKFERGRN